MSKYGDIHKYKDYKEMLREHKDEADGAIITTPHFLHYPQIIDCLDTNLFVLVEKPAANSVEETRNLILKSREKKVFIMVGQTRRFLPENIWLKNWIQSSAENFGSLKNFSLNAFQNIKAWIASKPNTNTDFWALDKKRAGGGVVISLLIHQIDLIRYLFGVDYVSVSAMGRYDAPFKNGAESMATGLLSTDKGAIGNFSANYLINKSMFCEAYNCQGEWGIISNYPTEAGVYSGRAHYASSHGKVLKGWNEQWEGINIIENIDYLNAFNLSFKNQLNEFINSLNDKIRPLSDIEENFNTIACVEAIYESILDNGQLKKVEKTLV